jgi:hypothetical protein
VLLDYEKSAADKVSPLRCQPRTARRALCTCCCFFSPVV